MIDELAADNLGELLVMLTKTLHPPSTPLIPPRRPNPLTTSCTWHKQRPARVIQRRLHCRLEDHILSR